MQFTLLTTDALFFALLITGGVYASYAARHEHLKAPWREVSKNALAVSAAVVLATFLVIAVLDSIHFYPRLTPADEGSEKVQYGTEVISMFDRLVGPLRPFPKGHRYRRLSFSAWHRTNSALNPVCSGSSWP